MFQLVAEKITQGHLEYLEMSPGTRAHILLYGTLTELIVSKVLALNIETIFQSQCPDLPSNEQGLKDMVSQLMSKDVNERKLHSFRSFLNGVKNGKVFKKSPSCSQMSLLWLQYMHAIETLLRFLKAE